MTLCCYAKIFFIFIFKGFEAETLLCDGVRAQFRSQHIKAQRYRLRVGSEG